MPDLDLLVYLPQLLDGLMAMLSDPNREIRVAAHKAMMVRGGLCVWGGRRSAHSEWRTGT